MSHLLILFLVPLIIALGLFILPTKVPKWLVFVLSLFPLGFLLLNHQSWIGSEYQITWIQSLGIQFHLGVDTLSYLFLLLMAIVTPISLWVNPSKNLIYSNSFYALIFTLQGLLAAFFMAKDLVVFTFFYEAMLLPLYFLISLWGGIDRQRAALKFLVYMIAGSFLLIAAIIGLYFVAHTFDIDLLASQASTISSLPSYLWIAAAFFLAFAVKTPLFPFHAWLPQAYTEASRGGSILLAAILSKAGIYGFLRVGREIFPEAMAHWQWILLGLAIAGVLWGALAAWTQEDYKKMIAYSSFSHVNFILCGVFLLNAVSQSGSVLQSLNHGITIMALFMVAGWLEDRIESTWMSSASGLAKYLPRLCWLTLFFVFASVAVPGTNNFIGELLIFFGLWTASPWLAALLGLSIILSVMYMLRWMQKMYFGTPVEKAKNFTDLQFEEIALLVPLIGLILWIGLYPMPLLNHIEKIFK